MDNNFRENLHFLEDLILNLVIFNLPPTTIKTSHVVFVIS